VATGVMVMMETQQPAVAAVLTAASIGIAGRQIIALWRR